MNRYKSVSREDGRGAGGVVMTSIARGANVDARRIGIYEKSRWYSEILIFTIFTIKRLLHKNNIFTILYRKSWYKKKNRYNYFVSTERIFLYYPYFIL